MQLAFVIRGHRSFILFIKNEIEIATTNNIRTLGLTIQLYKNTFQITVFIWAMLLALPMVVAKPSDSLMQQLPFEFKHLNPSEQVDLINLFCIKHAWQQPHQAEKYAKHARDLAHEIHYPLGEAAGLHHLGNVHFFLGRLEDALTHYQSAQEIYDSLQEEQQSDVIRSNIAEVYRDLEELNTSQSLLRSLIPKFERKKDSLNWAISLRRYGVLLDKKGESTEALKDLEKALELANAINDSIGIGLAHSELGSLYMKLQDFETAKQHLLQAIEVLEKIKLEVGILITNNKVADLLILQKQYLPAIQLLKGNIARLKKIQFRKEEMIANQLLAKAYQAAGMHQESLLAYRQFTKLKDLIFSEKQSNQIAQLQVKYQMREKELLLEELKANEAVQSLKIWFLIMLFALSGLAFGIWFRSKKKSEKQMKQQYQEIEKKNQLIKLKHEQIEEVNKELTKAQSTISQQNEQLLTANSNLEQKVSLRTKELQQAIQELTATNQELDTIIYRASHDLKSPLASLKGLANLGRHEQKIESARVYFKRVEQTTQYMLSQLAKLANVYRFKHYEPTFQPVKLMDVIDQVTTENEYRINKINLQLEISIPSDFILQADVDALKAALSCVFENSLDFSSTSQVPQVKIWTRMQSGWAEIHLQDNGIGIRDDFKENIFEMFFRGSSRSGGAGLGLYVSQLAVNAMDGSIEVYNSPNQVGTHFCLRVPQ